MDDYGRGAAPWLANQTNISRAMFEHWRDNETMRPNYGFAMVTSDVIQKWRVING